MRKLLTKSKKIETFTYLAGFYLADPNYWPALIWPRPKLAFGQLGLKFGQDSPKKKLKIRKLIMLIS